MGKAGGCTCCGKFSMMSTTNLFLLIAAVICILSCASCTATGGRSSPKTTEQAVKPHTSQSESPEEESGDLEWNRLSLAISEGSTEKVKALLASRPDFILRKDGTGLTALHYAAISNQSDVALCLIKSGPDINAQDDRDMTPLHFAAKKGHLEVTRVLLDHHAFINVIDRDGKTPLAYAQEGGFRDIISLLQGRHGKIPKSPFPE